MNSLYNGINIHVLKSLLLIKAARVVCHSVFYHHSCSATIPIPCFVFLILKGKCALGPFLVYFGD
jgi:hypothetical protein